jgi:HAD superfamily hydrolase (TIGR01490 family)
VPAPALTPEPAHKLVVFDFDGTLLEGHSPVRMVKSLARRRVIPFGVSLKIGWWGMRYKLRFNVEQATVRKYIFRSFVDLSAREADLLIKDLYRTDLEPRLRPKALEAMKKHQEAGEKIIIVSASFEPIVSELVKSVGAYHAICTQMEVIDGYYTGNVIGEPPEGEQKLIQLKAFANEHFGEGNWKVTWAYGDHSSDEFLMATAEHSVAVNPDARLERDAKAQGWQILDWEFTPPRS